MTSAMSYRAGNGMGHHVRGPVALGHCAFHTSAEDRDASQPHTGADGRFAIVLDGYIANYADLRTDLLGRGAALRNRSDAELFLQAYMLWGPDCLDRLEGEFACIIADHAEQTLLCACDHTGLRQLHYHWDGRSLVAATDIAGVLAALPEQPAPNLPYLAEHVANEWYSQDETPWQGIKRLPKAHSLIVGASGTQRREYWHLPTEVTIRHASDAEYAEHYRSVLTDCVRAASRSDAPLACDVSGGLDSSAIFCIADRLEKSGALPAPALHGFTLRAPEGTAADEAMYVRAVERQTSRAIAPVDLFMPDLDWFARQGEVDHRLPFLPNTVMVRSMAGAAANKGCRINLVGQGGDQWLDGLPHHFRQALQMRDWNALGQNWRADWRAKGAIWTVREFAKQSAMALAPAALHDRLKRFRQTIEASEDDSAAHILSDDMRSVLAERRAVFAARFADIPPDDRIKRLKLESPFPLLVYDMMNLQASRSGLEYRHPMLSRRFISFSAATPEHIRWRGGQTKFIHRVAMSGVLPNAIVRRDSKAHFNQTFYKHLPTMRQTILQDIDKSIFSTLVDPLAVKRMVASTCAPPFDRSPIWTLWGLYASAAFLSQNSAANKE